MRTLGLGLTLVALLWLVERDGDVASIVPDRATPPGQAECPAGTGPSMVRLPEGFCIDTTEVTRGQYAAWLGAEPSLEGQPSACAANDDYTPTCAFDGASARENQPVVCVDWCDARAFCEAAGKRLCGGVEDGESYPFADYADPAVSEWQAACTSGGAHSYTYGDELDTEICRGADAETAATWGFADVGSFPGCQSPEAAYAGVFDLSGHAAEWDNSCDGEGADANCRIRGGSFEHNEHGLRCAMGERLHWPRMRTVVSVGFRCCAD
ncbi:MAG: SUMF1/EgtB/PvdO family nonheme iron enzyme [Myxococcota bacterium]